MIPIRIRHNLYVEKKKINLKIVYENKVTRQLKSSSINPREKKNAHIFSEQWICWWIFYKCNLNAHHSVEFIYTYSYYSRLSVLLIIQIEIIFITDEHFITECVYNSYIVYTSLFMFFYISLCLKVGFVIAVKIARNSTNNVRRHKQSFCFVLCSKHNYA